MVGVYNQYPHTLYMEVSQPSTYNEYGDRIPGVSEWVLVGSCREEPNGKGALIITADRKEYRFSSLIQMPAGIRKVTEGVRVRVMDGEAERIMGSCAKFDQGRLHSRMWV